MTPLIRSTIRDISNTEIDPIDMKWFDISGAKLDQETLDLNWLHKYRPPFEKCMVVWESHSEPCEVLMMVDGADPEEGIVLSVLNQQNGKLPPMIYAIVDGAIKCGSEKESDNISEREASGLLHIVTHWYKLLAQGIAAHTPHVRQTFTNQRKIAQGKMPAYDWTTVYIEPVKERSDSKGGTHASPRLHDRRGHLRRLQSGQNVWVRPCKVGDVSKGIVWHDYAIKEAA